MHVTSASNGLGAQNNADCKKILKETSAQVKIMSQLCKRLIPVGTLNSDYELKDNKPNFVQIVPDFLMNFKINCKNRPAPCKIQISCTSDTPINL